MKSKDKICLVYNYAQHYRKDIFIKLDTELDFDFVFGDKMDDVKKMDYNLLINVKELSNIKIIKKPFYYQKGIFKVFKSYNKFLLLGDLNSLSTWLFLMRSKLTSKKVYLWSHGWYGKETILKTIMKKFFFNMATGVFLYGEYAKKLMIKNGFNKEKLFVIYNSLSYDEQLRIRENLKVTNIFKKRFNNNNANLIFIGRLTEVKKLDMLIDSLSLLEKKSVLVNLTLVGEGVMKEELEEMVKDKNIKNVWFYGASYDETEISELIYNADICVSPGNVGLTSIHSMVYGTPVITHDNFSNQMPEFESIKPGVTGDFFNENNCEDLAFKIEEWIIGHGLEREHVRERCFKEVDLKWNPNNQIKIFKQNLYK